jgi:SAM-dependent methyltransferase
MVTLPPGAFAKEDAGDDALFYRPARLVTHIDAGAVAALTARYAEVLQPGADVLDLMSSWVSHLPEVPLGEVVGHGMNAEELRANPRLQRWFVQDLNRDPALPLGADSLDAVLCCVGVQYLQRPLEVFAEVARVLRPGGTVVVSFSNRCFPPRPSRPGSRSTWAAEPASCGTTWRGRGSKTSRPASWRTGGGATRSWSWRGGPAPPDQAASRRAAPAARSGG